MSRDHTQLLVIAALLVVSGCAAPKDSYKHFAKPKYAISTTKVRNGVPSVRQTWWSKAWFWQPMGGNKRKGKSIRIR